MTHSPSVLPPPPPEHRRIAAERFDRANQVIATGNFDYGIQLLITCCKLDPANLIYRQALRRTERVKYKNNLRGSTLAFLTNSPAKAKLKAAKGIGDHFKVLECGEEALARNPWDIGVQMDMAEAADALGLLDMAIWLLEQARQKDQNHVALNRYMARLCEKRGQFATAYGLWALIFAADPNDQEARRKAKDLAAADTIAKGHYEESVGAESLGKSADEGKLKPENADRFTRETAALHKRIDEDPTNGTHYLQLAAIYKRGGHIEQARKVLEQGLGPTGKHFPLMVELAELDLEPFRRDLAISEAKLRDDPGNEELRAIRISLLKEINSRELDLYRQKLDRFPSDTANRIEMGIRLLRAGQVDEAIRELQAARTDPRHQWRAFAFLGHCFKTRKNWKLARRNFEDALKHMPAGEVNSRKEVLFQLAQGCADTGDLAAAVEFGMELANLDFGYREIGRLLDEWQERLQKA